MSTLQHEDLANFVCSAVADVFSTMLALDAAPGVSYIHDTAPPNTNGVVSFIGLAGPWVGTGSITCSTALACKIATQLMMTEYAAVDDDVLDAVAEITNMIIGNVKTSLEERLGPMGLSIPTVIYGRNFSSRTVGKQEWTIVPFDVQGESLEVQVCLAPAREAARKCITLAGHEALAI